MNLEIASKTNPISLWFILSQVYSKSDAEKAKSNLTQIVDEKLKELQIFVEKSKKSDENLEKVSDIPDKKFEKIDLTTGDRSLIHGNTSKSELISSTESNNSGARMNILQKNTYLFVVFVVIAAAICSN